MLDNAARDEWERKIARALGRLGQEQLDYLIEKLGDPPNFNNLSREDWDKLFNDTSGILLPALESIYQESAKGLLDTVPLGVDWTLINERAADWAGKYNYQLVSNINANTQRLLQKRIADYYRKAQTVQDLKDSLAPAFGVVRADAIAVTEVTRASAQGEQGTIDELRQQGIEMKAQWHTLHDEIVCPICRPRNRTFQGDGWTELPPAHPRCRCSIGWTFEKND